MALAALLELMNVRRVECGRAVHRDHSIASQRASVVVGRQDADGELRVSFLLRFFRWKEARCIRCNDVVRRNFEFAQAVESGTLVRLEIFRDEGAAGEDAKRRIGKAEKE